jgi:hypothetical protein
MSWREWDEGNTKVIAGWDPYSMASVNSILLLLAIFGFAFGLSSIIWGNFPFPVPAWIPLSFIFPAILSFLSIRFHLKISKEGYELIRYWFGIPYYWRKYPPGSIIFIVEEEIFPEPTPRMGLSIQEDWRKRINDNCCEFGYGNGEALCERIKVISQELGCWFKMNSAGEPGA